MNIYHVYINSSFAGYVNAVSYRQAKLRAKRQHRGAPVDVIGLVSSKAKV